MKTFLVALGCFSLGVLATLFVAHHLEPPGETVRLAEDVRIFGPGHQLIASLGRGTLCEVKSEGSVRWLTLRASFAEKTPPFEPAEPIVGGERSIEIGPLR